MRSIKLWMLVCSTALALGAAGCSSESGMPGDDDDDDDVCTACPGPDAAPDPGDLTWTPLITGEWTLPPGGEETSDVHQVTMERDVYVGAIRPIEPLGTHHTVLGFDTSTAGIIYASGVGTNAVVFPEGVGLKFPAGSTLSLQLHIYNVSDEPLSGTSGIEIVEVDPDDVEVEADLFLPGPFLFSLPPGEETTVKGTCTVQSPQTIFALFPHMHQLGTWFKTTVHTGGEQIVLHDQAYDFDEQAFSTFEPIELSPGDTIETECTWMNTLDKSVTWGESSDAEMCFSILYRYPGAQDEFCSN